jgi:hypothetical protein
MPQIVWTPAFAGVTVSRVGKSPPIRREQHQHEVFHARVLLDLGGLHNVFLDPLQQPHAERSRDALEAEPAGSAASGVATQFCHASAGWHPSHPSGKSTSQHEFAEWRTFASGAGIGAGSVLT